LQPALQFTAFLFCALVAAGAGARADSNTGIVYVHVLDAKTGKAQSGWTVQVTGRDGDSQALTGESGQVTFLAVSPGLARIDVIERGKLGACPAIIMVSANEETVVNVHVRHGNPRQIGCSPKHAQTLLKSGVTADVYDIY
jgi:hypothetical protein